MLKMSQCKKMMDVDEQSRMMIFYMRTQSGLLCLEHCCVDVVSACFECCLILSLHPSSKLDNSRSVTSGGSGPHVHVEFCQYAGHMSSYVDYRVCPDVAPPQGQTDICQRFSVSFNFFPFVKNSFFTQQNLSVSFS